jgi:dGTPase
MYRHERVMRAAHRIADYIAGMTDRYALIEHAKYFKAMPELW